MYPLSDNSENSHHGLHRIQRSCRGTLPTCSISLVLGSVAYHGHFIFLLLFRPARQWQTHPQADLPHVSRFCRWTLRYFGLLEGVDAVFCGSRKGLVAGFSPTGRHFHRRSSPPECPSSLATWALIESSRVGTRASRASRVSRRSDFFTVLMMI